MTTQLLVLETLGEKEHYIAIKAINLRCGQDPRISIAFFVICAEEILSLPFKELA